MKKFESQLGHINIFSESVEDLIQNVEYDAVLLTKDIVPVLERCNAKNPYDCEVLTMLVARIAAMIVSNIEDADYHPENSVREMFDFYLENFRKARDGEIECEMFDVE